MERKRYWTKALSEEFWSGVVTPLMFSIAGGLIEERMAQKGVRVAGLKQLERERFLRSFGGQVYLNSRVLEEVVRLIPSVFMTPEVMRFLPDAIRQEVARVHVPLFSGNTFRILLRFFTLDIRWAPFWNHRVFEKAAARAEEIGRRFRSMTERELSTAELLERIRVLYKEMGDFLEVVAWGVVFAYVARPLTDYLAQKWGHDTGGELAARLRVGLEGVKTFEINRQIEVMADEVRSDPRLDEWFDESDGQGILGRLQQEGKVEGFLQRFQSFLEREGHRFHGRDIHYPTWRERPGTIMELIRMNRGRDHSRRAFSLQQEARMQAERSLKNRIGKGGLGPVKRALFSLILSYDQRYLVIRENMRYYADVYLEQFRRIYLEIGRRWRSCGRIQGPEDIVFLSREEIEEACDTNADLTQTVEHRKKEYERSRHLLIPEFILDGEDVPVFSGLPKRERFFLKGESASPGRVTGRARIIREPEDLFDFEKGDILVAQSTDPSWTPVLSMASGLVLEVGGVLSHGAILAREYRIPALIQVEGALESIRTGDRLELDTERRCVRVLK